MHSRHGFGFALIPQFVEFRQNLDAKFISNRLKKLRINILESLLYKIRCYDFFNLTVAFQRRKASMSFCP